MTYPGERIQTDVKFVPGHCVNDKSPDAEYYQFTATDGCSRQRYPEGFADRSSYPAATFLLHASEYFKFPVKCVQTDNGFGFTKTYTKDKPKDGKPSLTLFQKILKDAGTEHRQIKPFTPGHNGKVERSHRKDAERFYNKHSFCSLNDFNKQLKLYNREYNNFPVRPPGWKSPNQYLKEYFTSCVTNI